ncbi:hypothetical protein JCM18750_13860 [Halostagnicola bangensis]
MKVACAVPATVPDESGVSEYKEIVTKIPPGPTVVIPTPERNATATSNMMSGKPNAKSNILSNHLPNAV